MTITYNFSRCSGIQWYTLIKQLRTRGSTWEQVSSGDMFDRDKVSDPLKIYYYRTQSTCRLVYYETDKRGLLKKKLKEITFQKTAPSPVQAVKIFRKLASSFEEYTKCEPQSDIYLNGIYSFYNEKVTDRGDVQITCLDMNSAYLHVLSQKLADYTTKTEVTRDMIHTDEYEYYCIEFVGGTREMFYYKDPILLAVAMTPNIEHIYGYKGKVFYEKTSAELYRLKCEVNKQLYKGVANLYIGCMHKRSGLQNNTTMAASIYAWFSYTMGNYVEMFKQKGYKVVLVTTDCIKIIGKYKTEDNIVPLGDGLGQFKKEYEGSAYFYSQGHFTQGEDVHWKGKPEYLRDGMTPVCKFIESEFLDEELELYIQYANTKKSKGEKK